MGRSLGLGLLIVLLVGGSAPLFAGGSPFLRGDTNDDGSVDIADAIGLLGVLFTPGSNPLACEDAGDANDDGSVDVADAISILGFLFTPGTPPLPEPFPNPGFDGTPTDAFTCGDEPVMTGPGGLVRIDAGNNSLAMDGEYTLRTANAFDTFWQSHAPGTTTPTVDFSTDIVLAVVRSYINGTHCVEVINATPAGIVAVRDYHWMLPCAPLIIPTVVYDIVIWEDAQQVPDPLMFNAQDLDVCPLPCP